MQTSIAVEALLDEKDAARLLGCSTALMRRWRQQGAGPPYLKISRLVRYDRQDLSAFLNRQRIKTAGEVSQ